MTGSEGSWLSPGFFRLFLSRSRGTLARGAFRGATRPSVLSDTADVPRKIVRCAFPTCCAQGIPPPPLPLPKEGFPAETDPESEFYRPVCIPGYRGQCWGIDHDWIARNFRDAASRVFLALVVVTTQASEYPEIKATLLRIRQELYTIGTAGNRKWLLMSCPCTFLVLLP